MNNLQDNIELSKLEKMHYEQVWGWILTKYPQNQDQQIPASIAAEVMNRSGLQREVLKNIWQISTNHSSYMKKNEFFLALKLISLQQNFIALTPENIKLYTILPKIEGFEQNINRESRDKIQIFKDEQKYEIQQKTLKRIEFYIDNKCKTHTQGVLLKNEAQALFQQSGQLDSQQQQKIWELCDTDNKGYLNRPQFIVALYFISLAKSGNLIPTKLPPNLLQFIHNYIQEKQQPKHRFSMQIPKQNSQQISEYDKKFEGLMNLLLKKMYDQEHKLQEYQIVQQEILNKDNQEIQKLEKLLDMCMNEDQKIAEQNKHLNVIFELTTQRDKNFQQKHELMENKIQQKENMLRQFNKLGAKILTRESKIEEILENLNQKTIKNDDLEAKLNLEIHKNYHHIQAQKKQVQNIEEKEPVISEFSQQENKQEYQQQDNIENEEEEHRQIDEASQKALHDYGLKRDKSTQDQSLRNASIKAQEEEVSKQGVDTIKEEEVDFEFMENQSNKKSVKSEDDNNNDDAKSFKNIRSKSREKSIERDGQSIINNQTEGKGYIVKELVLFNHPECQSNFEFFISI